MKLYYFDSPGRAEIARIMLHVGGVPFEDVRFDRKTWDAEYKAKSPTGACPFLELDDGHKLCQSSAISYYAASLSGFLPADPWAASRILELMACLEEVYGVLTPTFAIEDKEQATAARKALISPGGAAYKIFRTIDQMASQSKGQYYIGDEPTLADVSIFVPMCSLNSGQMPGWDRQAMDAFPKLQEIRKKFAAEPKVAAYYAKQGEQSYQYKCFEK